MSEIEIEIDGKKLSAQPDAMVIQVADEAGIYIPRFCYHKHLSIAANCRMCLVEVEKSGKPLPACATPVVAGMKVFTKSPKALAAQKAVMEFLLINHPLDCPICDQGGECELQDLAMGYGSAESFYNQGKRTVKDKEIGPLISTDMTRCIQCTRCVRFGAEVAGIRELGALNRGGDLEIGTYINHAMESEVSGNVIDICPVGALTSKPFRFTARPWELQQRASIAAHDCVGANVNIHTRRGSVMRVVPRENTAINETWISDRDRFSYEGLYHVDRVTKPLIKKGDKWLEADWETALEFAVGGLQRALSASNAEQLGALVSPSATLEEFYLLQKIVRGIGSNNIDHRLRQTDFSDQDNQAAFPTLGSSIADLESCDVIFLVGSNIQKEQPSAALRVRKAALKGAKVIALNMCDFDFHFPLAEKTIVAPDEMLAVLAKMVSALEKPESTDKLVACLRAGKKVSIVLGSMALNHPQAATIRSLCAVIAKHSGAQLGLLTEGANAAGAWLAGAIPHRGAAGTKSPVGLDAQAMLRKPRKAYIFMNVEPDLDVANPLLSMDALQQAEFVVSLSVFKNSLLAQHANVILPIAAFTETSGTFINAAGDWQKFNGAANPYEEARPAWKVLRVLGNLFQLQGFEYTSSEEVYNEVKALVEKMPTPTPVTVALPADMSRLLLENKDLYRVGGVPIYATDGLVRRAKSLQSAQPVLEGNTATARMHPATAARLHLEEGVVVTVKQQWGQARLPLVLDARLPERAVYIASGIEETLGLSELFGVVEISR